jgi:hypothetical protein
VPKTLKKQHFSDQHINKLVHDQLKGASKQRLVQHLNGCAVCRQRETELDREKRQSDSAQSRARGREYDDFMEQMDKEEGTNES